MLRSERHHVQNSPSLRTVPFLYCCLGGLWHNCPINLINFFWLGDHFFGNQVNELEQLNGDFSVILHIQFPGMHGIITDDTITDDTNHIQCLLNFWA